MKYFSGDFFKRFLINRSYYDSKAVARNEFLVASIKIDSYQSESDQNDDFWMTTLNMKIVGSLSSVIRSENQ